VTARPIFICTHVFVYRQSTFGSTPDKVHARRHQPGAVEPSGFPRQPEAGWAVTQIQATLLAEVVVAKRPRATIRSRVSAAVNW